jgi:hypothetical protein
MNTYKNFLEIKSISQMNDSDQLFALMLYQGLVSSSLGTSFFLYPEKKMLSSNIKIKHAKACLLEIVSIINSAFIMCSLINCLQNQLDMNQYDLEERTFIAIFGACEFYFYNLSHNYFEGIIHPFYIEEKTD